MSNNSVLDLDLLDQQVTNGFDRRNSEIVSEVFNNFKDKNTGRIPISSISEALIQARSRLHDLDVLTKLRLNKKNGDDGADAGLDEDEFTRVVQSSDVVQRWIEQLPLAQVMADALPDIIIGTETGQGQQQQQEEKKRKGRRRRRR